MTSSFSCFCPVINHEFRRNIVKVAVDPQTTLTMLCWNSLSITGQTHEKLTSICFFTITNCQIVCSRSLPHRINYKFMCLSLLLTIKISQWVSENLCCYRKKLFWKWTTCSPLKLSLTKRKWGDHSLLVWPNTTHTQPLGVARFKPSVRFIAPED